MARPARVDVPGGLYHVTARGIERRAIFSDVHEHEHFLALLPDMSERYGVDVLAYTLMGNHYHLLIRTPHANASAAIQWLNVSYSVWFNKRRQRVGHVFQGRFGSVLIDGEGAWALHASVYIHLNPVHTRAFGLDKRANRTESLGLVAPNREEVRRRLHALRAFPWSSYRAYAGYESIPDWLVTKTLLARIGGSQAYRRYVHNHVTRGTEPEGYEDVKDRPALGSQAFLEKAKRWVRGLSGEQPGRRYLCRKVSIEQVVALVEKKWGRKWGEFAETHGDWGRDLTVYLARKRSGLTLRQIGESLGGMEYKAVGKAAQRFEASLPRDRTRKKMVEECLAELSLVET
jgi:REP element-mobilizing transposase RayT